MTDLAPNPAFAQIEDRLDAIGQKFRVQQILRGVMLFLAYVFASTVLAGVIASLFGSGNIALLLSILWLCGLFTGAFFWIVRPVLLQIKLVQVARLLESRIPGLHNGLTNSVLLAERNDLSHNPWLNQILDENWQRASGRDLSSAVRLAELKPVLWRTMLVVLASAALAMLFWSTLAHGWQQMIHPQAFVPKSGSGQIIEVKPGDATIVYGQPLEITIVGMSATAEEAKLIFDNAMETKQLPGTAQESIGGVSTWRFTHRVEHVEQSLRYRVELAGTQSPWYQVKVVRQVRLQHMAIDVVSPAYTRAAGKSLSIKPDEIEKTPISVPQGSTIDLSFSTDIPVNGAMLQVGESSPSPMTLAANENRFNARFSVVDDTPVSLLLTDGSGQIIARLPEQSLVIRAIKDAVPVIDMRWPTQDVNISPDSEIRLQAQLKDDYGLASIRVLTSSSADQPLVAVTSKTPVDGTLSEDVSYVLSVPKEHRVHGNSVRVQIEATDNRNLTPILKDGSGQVATSNTFEIRFRDQQKLAAEQKEQADKLRQRLMEMLKKQQDLLTRTVSAKPADATTFAQVHDGQKQLRELMKTTAETFEFDASSEIVQKTLHVLYHNAAAEAADLSAALIATKESEPHAATSRELQARQRRIISTLEGLLALLAATPEPTTQPTQKRSGDLTDKADEFKKLAEALKQFIKEEQRILDQSANLAKKPVDNWDEKDKKLLEELQMSQEKLDAFMQTKVNDLSKLAEQDMANASMLKELLEVYSEVTMAKDALKQKAMEIAVPAEEAGVELAKSLENNLEKWLMDTPDRQKWTQEEMPGKTDVPMPELPTELEDMIGELMEQQEDLFEDMEDMDANIADSPDKGAGWDAMDGPIASMSAKGVTGNVLPNDNNVNGRSGEGRSGKSQGEFVEDTATGKGGRNTPTRLDPTPFQQGQVKDESKDPVGGATGGGKISGQGGEGLEGPVGPKLKQEMERLAQKQAQLRNQAERLNLQYQLGRYDNFRLLESIALMRRVESDLNANRYQTALRRRDVMLDAMDSSKALVGGTIHVQHDTTPTTSAKLEQDIHDAMKGQLPAAWSEALKEYYRKLAVE